MRVDRDAMVADYRRAMDRAVTAESDLAAALAALRELRSASLPAMGWAPDETRKEERAADRLRAAQSEARRILAEHEPNREPGQ